MNSRVRPYKHTVVWQWLNSKPAPSSEIGTIYRALRSRMDMPHRFPNRRYLYDYLVQRARIDPVAADRHVEALWSAYYDFNQRYTHSTMLPKALVPDAEPELPLSGGQFQRVIKGSM